MNNIRIAIWILLLPIAVFCFGCESLRFAPDETQKQNAYIHAQATQIAANLAENENTSKTLQDLTSLSSEQSRAFLAYYGLPCELPAANTAEQILSESNMQICDSAITNASRRPDGWEIANNALDIGIAVAGVLGGAFGIKIASFLKTAQNHSSALREIIEGNQSYIDKNPNESKAFKSAQKNQTSQTKTLVTQIKADLTKT